ncbi:MAG TPA: AraC family transcriptional regulator, partial [Pseudolysinimonas sp.]|nr:AraC family transcriptional regulator [Pseudolysinimonas sp.]
MDAADRIRAWRPPVPGVHEVLHAEFHRHAYPAHTHEQWSLLLIDAGEVAYELDGHHRLAPASTLTMLPPHVAHDGRSSMPGTAFRKRVVYLDADWLDRRHVDRFVDRPLLRMPGITAAVRRLHDALLTDGDGLRGESELLRIRAALERGTASSRPLRRDDPLAARLRAVLDADLAAAPTLRDAARVLGASPGHLVRTFSAAYGMPPHRYLTGRRVDRARRLLLDGMSVAAVAQAVGFFDQAHLTR